MNSPTGPPESSENRVCYHTRTITCSGYARADGLWDIEGEVIDVKSYDFVPESGDRKVQAGAPVHQLRLILTVDDRYLIRAARATALAVPYSDCRTASESYGRLVGLRFAPGLGAAIRERLGGTAGGCTHLTDLIGPMATTAYQTMSSGLGRRDGAEGRATSLRDQSQQIGTCHALRAGGEVARRFGATLVAEGITPPPAGAGERTLGGARTRRRRPPGR